MLFRSSTIPAGAAAPKTFSDINADNASEPKPSEQRRNISRRVKCERAWWWEYFDVFMRISPDVDELFQVEQ